MRITQVLLPNLKTAGPALWTDTALAAMITHNDAASIGSCVAFVRMLWGLLSAKDIPDPEWWVEEFVKTVRDIEPDTSYKSRSENYVEYIGPFGSFVDQYVLEAFNKGLSVRETCDYWHSGVYLLETVPSVVYILMKYGDDPERAIIAAVNDTKDNDTIAAIVGAAVGALHEKSSFPERWLTRLSGATNVNDYDRIFELINSVKVTPWVQNIDN